MISSSSIHCLVESKQHKCKLVFGWVMFFLPFVLLFLCFAISLGDFFFQYPLMISSSSVHGLVESKQHKCKLVFGWVMFFLSFCRLSFSMYVLYHFMVCFCIFCSCWFFLRPKVSFLIRILV